MSGPRRSELVVRDGRVYHLGLAPEELAAQVIVVGDPARAETVAAKFDEVHHEVRNREFVTLTGTLDDTPLSVIGTGIGADNLEITLVEAFILREMDLDSGIRRARAQPLTILRVGTSGGARDDIAPGTLGISSYAIGLDNTGRFFDAPADDDWIPKLEQAAFAALEHGTRPESPSKGKFHPYASKASPDLVTALERAARKAHAPSVTGVTVTAPGFYGASGRFIDGLDNAVPAIKQRLGALQVGEHKVINFEMESSLLFRLAGVMGYRAATICSIISTVSNHATVSDHATSIDRGIEVALGAMLESSSEPG